MAGHVYSHPWRRVVSMTEAKAKLGELIRDAADQDVLIVRRSKAAAILVADDRWWAYLEDIEDLRDRVALLEWKADPEEAVPLAEVEPRAVDGDEEYDVVLTPACVEQLNEQGSPWRWRLCAALRILAKNPAPVFSHAIPGLPGARRYQVGTRRLAYERRDHTIMVVRVGFWLVKPDWSRADAARDRSDPTWRLREGRQLWIATPPPGD